MPSYLLLYTLRILLKLRFECKEFLDAFIPGIDSGRPILERAGRLLKDVTRHA